MNYQIPLMGYPIVVSEFMPKDYKQIKFPKSRRARIRKKWAKRKSNWGLVDAGSWYISYDFSGSPVITMSPEYYRRMNQIIDRRNRDRL